MVRIGGKINSAQFVLLDEKCKNEEPSALNKRLQVNPKKRQCVFIASIKINQITVQTCFN